MPATSTPSSTTGSNGQYERSGTTPLLKEEVQDDEREEADAGEEHQNVAEDHGRGPPHREVVSRPELGHVRDEPHERQRQLDRDGALEADEHARVTAALLGIPAKMAELVD